MEDFKPTQMNKKYFTPVVIGLAVLVLNGLIFLLARFIFGIGAVTNLDDQHPWGIWIGLDVGAGVALAAGSISCDHQTSFINSSTWLHICCNKCND